MIRIAICCGEGYSSGFLSRYLAEAVVKEKLQDRVSFIFIPFWQLYDRQEEADIAFVMPHMGPRIVDDKREYRLPMYIIPYKVAIKPKAEDYLEDAEDIMEISGGKGGLFCFPGEEHLLHVTRLMSHRKFMNQTPDKRGRRKIL